MKHELLYETQEAFTTAQGNSGNVTSVTPGVAYIVETGAVPHFNKVLQPLIAIYDVNDISTTTKIFNSDYLKTNLSKITIDKASVPVSSITKEYQFNTTGRHKIVFYFSSLTEILTNAFGGCASLIYVKLPKETTLIKARAFANCTNLETINLRNATVIEEASFSGDTSLHNIERFEKLTSFGAYAFDGCSSISGKLTIPSGITTISNYAFRNCSGITSVDLSSTVTIGNYAFCNCKGITESITIPESVTAIGEFAFASCINVTGDLILPETLTSVGVFAFSGLPKIKNISIYNTQYTFDMRVFRYAGGAGNITYTGDGTGTLNVYGLAKKGDDARPKVGRIIFHSDYDDRGGYFLADNPTMEQIIIKGDFIGERGLLHTYGPASQLAFVEILGNGSGRVIYSMNGPTSIKKNGIIHLGYDGKTNFVPTDIISHNYIRLIQTPKIYVGDGSSLAHDQAIYDLYAADTDSGGWNDQTEGAVNYMQFVDLWYNYHGEFREE